MALFLDFRQESELIRSALQRMDWWDGAGEKKAKGPAGRAQLNRGQCGWRGECIIEGFLTMNDRTW